MATRDKPSLADIVVNYNIHGCRGRDGHRNIDRYVNVLNELNPSIVGLQEVDSRQGPDVWKRLADTLEMYPLPGPTLFRGNGRYGNLLLSRHPVQRVKHYNLGVSGREPRRAIDAIVETRAGSLRVIVTHLGLSGHERREQLIRLNAHVAADWDNGPVVIMGDFNEWLTPRRVAGRIHPELTCPVPAKTFPSALPLLSLDQIFCYPPALLQDVRTLRSATTRAASDHLPLMANLCLKQAGEGVRNP